MHPQSIVHGLVRFRDGALLAHLGPPDMRVPISYALTLPATRRGRWRRGSTWRAPSRWSSSRPTPHTFRCLALARAAGEAGGTAPCMLNAANEEAVAAFLAGAPASSTSPPWSRACSTPSTAEPLRTSLEQCARRTAARARLHDRRGDGGGVSYLRRHRSACWCSSSSTSSATSSPPRPSACARSASRSASRRAIAAPPDRRHRVRAGRDPAGRLRQDPGDEPARGGRPVGGRRPARPLDEPARGGRCRRSASSTTRPAATWPGPDRRRAPSRWRELKRPGRRGRAAPDDGRAPRGWSGRSTRFEQAGDPRPTGGAAACAG